MAKRPVMLHRAIFGSIERFFGILIEHFAGKFPLWISPLPIRVITIADRHNEYAHHVMRKIKKAGFICDVDDSQESMNKKIRNAQLLQINYMLTIGDKEMENKTVNLRTRDNVVHGEVALPAFLSALQKEMTNKSLEGEYAHSHNQ
jgi:threonyl-tRNA synthetase